jgi:hypothetical protein
MIAIETVKQLALGGHQAPSADNSQPWRFEWDGSRLSVHYDAERVKGKTFPANSPAILLSLGAAIENIIELSMSYNLDTQIYWNPENVSPTRAVAEVSLQGRENKPNSDRTAQHPVYKRHTNRFAFHKTPLLPELIERTASLSEGDARLLIIDKRDLVQDIGQLVKLASEIRFQIKEVHEWLGKSLRFSEEDVKKADGLDIRTIDLPPGGALFLKFISSWSRMRLLNNIGAYKFLAHMDSAPISAAPALIAVIAPANFQGAFDAGKLMCRAWTYLNAQGIAAHPYYVVADQLARLQEGAIPNPLIEKANDLKEQTDHVLSLGEGETLHMLMRVGYPKHTPPRSLRLPEEIIFRNIAND